MPRAAGCRGVVRVISFVLASALAVMPASARDAPVTNWRAVVSDADRDRLRNARQAWADALAKARTMNVFAM